jgi:hypothetical protein
LPVTGMRHLTRPIRKGEKAPREAELQLEFFIWLADSWDFAGRVDLEMSDVATGRADVFVWFGDIELITEVERELTNAAPESLETAYVPQAAQCSGSNEPFSQPLILDLNDHSNGVAPLQDLSWAAERRVAGWTSPHVGFNAWLPRACDMAGAAGLRDGVHIARTPRGKGETSTERALQSPVGGSTVRGRSAPQSHPHLPVAQ